MGTYQEPCAESLDLITELTAALNQMFFAVLRVRPAADQVWILQNRDQMPGITAEMSWTAYLERYGALLSEEERAKAFEQLCSRNLLAAAAAGRSSMTLDLSCWREDKKQTNWLTVTVLLRRQGEGELYAYVFVRQSNEEHLLRSIIDVYVYSTCDFFIHLNMRDNTYVMFSGSASGMPLPPRVCEDYDAAMADYVRTFVVPEDRDLVMEKARLNSIRRQLEKKEVYTFTAGMADPTRGYTRKQFFYRYYDRRTQMVLLTQVDVTEMYQEEWAHQQELQAARLQAETDPLTGLLNYGGLSSRIQAALSESDGVSALLFIDLDDFKQVNDTCGHQEGDRLLRSVAQELQSQTRDQDLRGRVGGDEFVVLLRDIQDREHAGHCAQRICEAVRRLPLPAEAAAAASCSIGVAFAPQDGRSYRELVFQADRRAYQAKAMGKGRFLLE